MKTPAATLPNRGRNGAADSTVPTAAPPAPEGAEAPRAARPAAERPDADTGTATSTARADSSKKRGRGEVAEPPADAPPGRGASSGRAAGSLAAQMKKAAPARADAQRLLSLLAPTDETSRLSLATVKAISAEVMLRPPLPHPPLPRGPPAPPAHHLPLARTGAHAPRRLATPPSASRPSLPRLPLLAAQPPTHPHFPQVRTLPEEVLVDVEIPTLRNLLAALHPLLALPASARRADADADEADEADADEAGAAAASAAPEPAPTRGRGKAKAKPKPAKAGAEPAGEGPSSSELSLEAGLLVLNLLTVPKMPRELLIEELLDGVVALAKYRLNLAFKPPPAAAAAPDGPKKRGRPSKKEAAARARRGATALCRCRWPG